MQQTVWAIDGSFFAQRISGIQRYSIELLAALDAIVPAGLVEIVVPQGVKTPAYTNIKVVPFGTRKGPCLAAAGLPVLPETAQRQGAGYLQRHPVVRVYRHCGGARCLLPRPAGFL